MPRVNLTLINDDGQSTTYAGQVEVVNPAPVITGVSAPTIVVGAVERIFGTGFRQGAQVFFGGVQSPSVVVSPDGTFADAVAPQV